MPTGAASVLVAVIDSGICSDHADLVGRITPGWDYVDDDSIPQDTFGHGCAISNIIAANFDNGVGMAGLAPNAMILPLRVLDERGVTVVAAAGNTGREQVLYLAAYPALIAVGALDPNGQPAVFSAHEQGNALPLRNRGIFRRGSIPREASRCLVRITRRTLRRPLVFHAASGTIRK